jgi:hypothetical protein
VEEANENRNGTERERGTEQRGKREIELNEIQHDRRI